MSQSESRLSNPPRNRHERRAFAAIAKNEGVNVATVWRWYFKGVRGVKLQTTVIGGRRYVTDEQWEAFVAALNNGEQAATSKSATNRSREKAIAAAERELERAGI